MKTILALLLLASPAFAQKIGFRGLDLGMSQTEVNRLVKTTTWEYGYRGGRDPEAPDTDKEEPKGIGIALYNKTPFECLQGSDICFRTTQVRAIYYKGRVFDIDVWGPWVDDSEAAPLPDYADAMIGHLTKIYGRPTFVYEPTASLAIQGTLDSLDRREESFIDLVEWQWTRPSKKKPKGNRKPAPEVVYTIRVRLYRAEESDTRRRHSTIIVDLTDEVATAEVDALTGVSGEE